jgi:hypothetical protein
VSKIIEISVEKNNDIFELAFDKIIVKKPMRIRHLNNGEPPISKCAVKYVSECKK